VSYGSDSFYREEASREIPKRRRDMRVERMYERRRKKRRSPLGAVAELLLTVAVAFALVFFVVRPFVVMSYFTPTESMVPTIEAGSDRVLANKFIYRFDEPDRGDIVVLEGVDQQPGEPPLLKRVVGLEGDEIQVQGGRLFLNGEPQDEPYLNIDEIPDASVFGPFTVPEDHVFVMGDNRGNSGDSRVFGPVPVENLEGEAFLRFWPLDRMGPL
jgi:signal peptidase I